MALFIAFALYQFLISDNEKLGAGYYYLPEYEANDIGYIGGGIIYKSSEKLLFSDIKIQGNVVSMSYDQTFIVALQEQDLKNSNQKLLNYYIIYKKTNQVYGPYTKKEYSKMCRILQIPEDLKLKD